MTSFTLSAAASNQSDATSVPSSPPPYTGRPQVVDDVQQFQQALLASSHHPNGLFVGNLSFFCQESDLFKLFSTFGLVECCRIVLNDSRTKSLMYGFVGMSTHEASMSATLALDNKMFMGRNMK